MIGSLGSVLAVALVIGSCTTPSPSPSPSATPLSSNPDGTPAGRLIRIDMSVEMAADNRTVTIHFIGGPVLPPNDPCYTGYVGWARLVAEDLDLAVVQVADVHPPPGSACAAAGVEREVQIVVDAPFLGTTATDLSDGHTLDIARPQ